MTKQFLLSLALLVSASMAQAGRIDFTDSSEWGNAHGETSAINGNVQISTNTGKLTQGGDFGIGIKSGLDDYLFDGTKDEIDDDVFTPDEVLTVNFLNPTVVRSIELLNLFIEHDYAENYGITVNPEVGSSVTLTGPITSPLNSDGLWIVSLDSGLGPISSLEFFIPTNHDFKSDFSLGAVVTPLPAAVWLFGSALLGLAAFSRRRSAA